MSKELTHKLESTDFFRLVDAEKRENIIAEFTAGNIWTMYDADLIRRYYIADAEALAESGIEEFIRSVSPYLNGLGITTPAIEEDFSDGHYSLRVNDESFEIYTAEDTERESREKLHGLTWGKASLGTARILNHLLMTHGSEERAYAYNGGNDLGFIFLTPTQHGLLCQFSQAQSTPQEMPYLMIDHYPDYGMPVTASIPPSPAKTSKSSVLWIGIAILLALTAIAIDLWPKNHRSEAAFNHARPIDNDMLAQLYTITADPNFTVRRSQRNPELDVTWVVQLNGKTVLEKNANGEDNYIDLDPHPVPSNVYTVYLTSFVEGAYYRVSNVVTVSH